MEVRNHGETEFKIPFDFARSGGWLDKILDPRALQYDTLLLLFVSSQRLKARTSLYHLHTSIIFLPSFCRFPIIIIPLLFFPLHFYL